MTVTSLIERLFEPDALETLFQPIVHVDGNRVRTHAFEALSRGPKGTNLFRADVLFEYVRRKHEEVAVDRLATVKALERVGPLAPGTSLSLNVHAATLGRDPKFVGDLLAAAECQGIDPAQLIVEVVEHAPNFCGLGFERSLRALRSAGVAIALDDIGLGQSNFRMMIECQPRYLKVDRFFVKDCHLDAYRYAVIHSLQQLADSVDAILVAEGVECAEELEALRRCGASFFQGYYFGAPVAHHYSLPTGELKGIPA